MPCSKNGFSRAMHATLRSATRGGILEAMKELRRCPLRLRPAASTASTVTAPATAPTDRPASTTCRPWQAPQQAATWPRTPSCFRPSILNREAYRHPQSITNHAPTSPRPMLLKQALRQLLVWEQQVALERPVTRHPRDRQYR